MRIRSIRPEFWSSEDIAAMDWQTRLVYIGLWSYVDDNGVGRDNEKLITAELFPLEDDPRDTLATVSRALATLSEDGQITRYTVARKPYFVVKAWETHQKIDKPGKQRYPLPTCDDAVIRDTLATHSRDTRETPSPGEGEKGRRGEGEKKPLAPKTQGTRLPDDWQPTSDLIDWVKESCPAVNGRTETENFRDYWLSKSGRDATKTRWDLVYRKWMRTEQERAPRPRAAQGRSTTDDRVRGHLALAAEFAARETNTDQLEITS